MDEINGTILNFGIGEFAAMIRLKCVNDDVTVYEKSTLNKLIAECFLKYKMYNLI